MSEVATRDESPAVEQIAQASQAVERVAIPELDYAARLGMWLAAAESNNTDPKARGMAAALRIEYARLLGLPPHAAAEIHLIKGNLTLSAKVCRALAFDKGLRVIRISEDANSCTAAVVDLKNGSELGRTTYTLAQAKKAGLSGTNWTNHPDRMLWARASKRALDDHAPWVTVGVITDDEVLDSGGIVTPALEDLPTVDLSDDDEVLTGDVVDEADDFHNQRQEER